MKLVSAKYLVAGVCVMAFAGSAVAQSSINPGQLSGQNVDDENLDQLNTITTAVPFLGIAPDSRAGGMGDVGVATSPDANSIHWNPAKLAFVDEDMGFSISYVPWLRELVPDINLSYLSGYKRIDKNQTIGGSLRYFSLGNIQFTDEFGVETRQFNPNEFALDVAYGRKLSERLSGGLSLRFIYSNLTGGTTVQGAESKPGTAVAADVSVYYENDEFKIFKKDGEFALGANISNMGNKMSYTETSRRDFIPINLRFGPRVTMFLDDYNKLSFSVDINKLLVPTPPIYEVDTNGQAVFDSDGNYVVISGVDPDIGVASGMFNSFTDAPGNVTSIDANGVPEIESGSRFREEMREFNIATGLEYWYMGEDKKSGEIKELFGVRAGYFHEHELKGNRKYFTLGAGLRYTVFSLDFAYLVPVYFGSTITQNSPLQNTLRFSLTFNFNQPPAGAETDSEG